MSARFSHRLQPARSMQRSDPAVVSVETPPRQAGANDVAASIEYLRAKEKALRSR